MSGATITKVPVSQIASLLADRALDVAKHLLPNGKQDGVEWVAGNIHGDDGNSLKVRISGNKAGVWCDFANPRDSGDLLELWAAVCGSKADAIKEAKEYLGIRDGEVISLPIKKPEQRTPAFASEVLRPLNEEFNARLHKRLMESPSAIKYLRGRGLSVETIQRFKLGLSTPYTPKDGVTQENALVFPMTGRRNGEFFKKYGYYNIPGVTQNPVDKNGWMKGSPQCYYADAVYSQRYMFVCEGIKDVWRHRQALEEAGILGDYLIVSSTHGSGIPQEWKGPEFWSRWEAVLLGHDNDEAGDAMAERIALLAGRELHRVKVPDSLGKDWTDFWQNGGDVHLFNQQVNNATVVSVQVKNSNGSPEQFGRVSYDPVDINGAYHGGHLYYIAQVMMREQGIDERGQLVPLERLETLVVRSDGTTHSYYKSPAPKGTPDSQRVLRLTDGTLISKEPKPNQYSTWSWQSISKYVDGKAKVRSIAEIVGDVVDLLKASVWLPYEEDYAVLAFTVPVTFLQSVFESVPLILLNGPAASGKTATGISMSKLCANGNVIGQVSAATAARHIDECRGFVVMDDLEAISAKGGKDAQFSELVQALKVSYNKYSGVKVWTDVKTMKTERLNFYGVKMINNTLGADDILGSRMIRVQTRSIPEGFQSEHLRDLTAEDEQKMAALRNELHTWAFMNVDQVAEVYSKEFANRSNRAAEIAAPLRVFARLVGDPALSGQLEASLARQSQKTIESDDPIDTLKEALENIVAQGYDTVTLTHIGMEMRSLLDANFGQSASTEIPEWSRPEWIGKVLRSNDLAKHGTSGRKRIFGKNLRLVGIADWFVSKVRDKFQQEGVEIETGTKGPDDFCRGCQDCPYRNNGCEIMTARLQVESKSKR